VVISRYGKMGRPVGQARPFGSGIGSGIDDGLRVRARSRGERIDSTDRPVGKKWTFPIAACTAPPSHLQGVA